MATKLGEGGSKALVAGPLKKNTVFPLRNVRPDRSVGNAYLITVAYIRHSFEVAVFLINSLTTTLARTP